MSSSRTWPAWLLFASVAAAQSQATAFDPREHGFAFVNTFKNDALPALNLETSGLCGGMSYAAVDFFLAKLPIPTQDYRPANGTPLHRFIYARQVKSLLDNAGRWLELYGDVRGVRRQEFFARGLDGREGGELAALRASLDAGQPVPLGLKSLKGMSHQVVAIGYDLGRYQGDLKEHQDELKIRLYDPNVPGKVRTMVPDVANRLYVYAEGPKSVQWTSYFVDVKYAAKVPPKLDDAGYPDDGLVHELVFECTTGKNDLRGGEENLDVVVHGTDGAQQAYANVNLGARWLGNYREHGRVVLRKAVPVTGLQSVELTVTGGDGWDLQRLRVRALGKGISVYLGEAGRFAFTPEQLRLSVPLAVPAKK